MICSLCPRDCHARRGDTSGEGFCRMGMLPRVARAALHHWEEPCISGTRGSGAVFFSGCTLRCVYCQNHDISAGGFGREVSVPGLRALFESLIAQGAHNINLVNPTHFTPAILDALAGGLSVPVVWNSSGYERVDTLRRLEGAVQVFLPDLKYVDSAGAGRLSGAADYPAYVGGALREMARQVGTPRLDEAGVIRRGLIVRHLVLPGRAEESCAVLDFIADHLPDGTWVSLMAQYTPKHLAAGMPPLNRRVTEGEYRRVLEHMEALGLTNGYVQQLEAADEAFIPAFDLTGVE